MESNSLPATTALTQLLPRLAPGLLKDVARKILRNVSVPSQLTMIAMRKGQVDEQQKQAALADMQATVEPAAARLVAAISTWGVAAAGAKLHQLLGVNVTALTPVEIAGAIEQYFMAAPQASGGLLGEPGVSRYVAAPRTMGDLMAAHARSLPPGPGGGMGAAFESPGGMKPFQAPSAGLGPVFADKRASEMATNAAIARNQPAVRREFEHGAMPRSAGMYAFRSRGLYLSPFSAFGGLYFSPFSAARG